MSRCRMLWGFLPERRLAAPAVSGGSSRPVWAVRAVGTPGGWRGPPQAPAPGSPHDGRAGPPRRAAGGCHAAGWGTNSSCHGAAEGLRGAPRSLPSREPGAAHRAPLKRLLSEGGAAGSEPGRSPLPSRGPRPPPDPPPAPPAGSWPLPGLSPTPPPAATRHVGPGGDLPGRPRRSP